MVDGQQMLERHTKIWHGFCRLLTWSLIGIVIVLVLMGVFLI